MNFGIILKEAHDIHQQTLRLNMSCAKLSGTAATIPGNAPFPLSDFAGTKVILHNVRYSFDKCAVVTSIKIPYKDKGNACEHSGKILEFEVTEDWFK